MRCMKEQLTKTMIHDFSIAYVRNSMYFCSKSISHWKLDIRTCKTGGYTSTSQA